MKLSDRSSTYKFRSNCYINFAEFSIGIKFCRRTFKVPLNKNGLQIKPERTLAKRNRTYDGLLDKTLSNKINRRKFQ